MTGHDCHWDLMRNLSFMDTWDRQTDRRTDRRNALHNAASQWEDRITSMITWITTRYRAVDHSRYRPRAQYTDSVFPLAQKDKIDVSISSKIRSNILLRWLISPCAMFCTVSGTWYLGYCSEYRPQPVCWPVAARLKNLVAQCAPNLLLFCLKANDIDKLKSLEMTFYRRLLGISDQRTNECVLNKVGADRELVATVGKLKLHYFGHRDYIEQREATETMGRRYKALDRQRCTGTD